MNKKIKKIVPYFIAIGIFFVSSFLQVPRGTVFLCSHDGVTPERKEYRLEYGLPYAYIKRAVSDFECRVEGKEHFENFLDSYNTHEINPLNFATDLYMWLSATYFLVKVTAKRKK